MSGRWPGRLVLAVLAACCVWGEARAEECPRRPNLGEKLYTYTATYENHAYDFGTVIPAGLTGVDNADTGYQHGFVIRLPGDGSGTIWVSGDVNSGGKSAHAEAVFDAGALKDVAARVVSVRYGAATLGGGRAARVSAEFQCKGDAGRYRHTSISAVKGRYVYSLMWEGPVGGAAAGEKVMGELVGSWRFYPAR